MRATQEQPPTPIAPLLWSQIVARAIDGEGIRREEAFAAATVPNSELLTLLDAAYRVRSHYYGRRVRVHILENAKSGICPEDCSFCSQSLSYHADIPRYGMKTVESLVSGAQRALEMGAVTYCMVTSTRKPSAREVQTVCDAARQIKSEHPRLKLCASLGMLRDDTTAEMLGAAGIDRYNHNLETSQRFFPEIVSTHRFEDRVATVRRARAAGLEACCGGILGMGETPEDWVELAFTLRELAVESIPLNFLDPREGTPLEDRPRLAPNDCLRALSMFRLVHPQADLRIAGGREVTLRSMQALALYPANSIFTNGYLTTDGAQPSADRQLIEDAGFEVDVV